MQQQILIVGKEGQLGSTFEELSKSTGWATFTFSTIDKLNLTDPESIKQFFTGKKFDFIINCAAYTAVDKAEEDRETAFKLNSEAPALLAEEAASMEAGFIHISTDYVFGGRHCRPLKPGDPKHPESVYGKSKLQGEEAVLKKHSQSMIIRTSWLYSPYGRNFLKTMLRLAQEKESLKVVFDQVGTPTLASDLAGSILTIIRKTGSKEKKFVPGVYHFSNEGVCSWYDFAVAIFREAGSECRVFPVESGEFPTKAPRPFYSVMDKSLIKNTYEIEIPHWQDSLIKCLKKIKNSGLL
ncbi:MAG: dTDP-4-dehydrorhamnose reductase [Anaerophaga sp.]|uniref:dTDP-4-dehydrorhamnose reductase n=1 Tax=Anaerophaga thermohalophila TaxID=177400 RepID=UPI0002D2B3E0|nr:dTDP-4-dehydrorhamnose reductase [Anaerophaga thermohalophila]MDK2843142.1 dTDP-4-dehydrorhamnose reductase [Anaerophaga sp.]